MQESIALQDRYAPKSICFGCGPANKKGLQIKSYPSDGKLIAMWQPQSQHQAFVGTINGGIIGALLDCHCNWAAAYHLMQVQDTEKLPCTVTAEYCIRLLKPTPSHEMLQLEAEVVETKKNRVIVSGKLMVADEVYDTCQGTFIAVKDGHPAFHRW